MTDDALNKILEHIYESLKNDNEGLDAHILALKILLHARKQKTVEIDNTKLVQPNRSGRKLMQSYFRKRGVAITFKNTESASDTQAAS